MFFAFLVVSVLLGGVALNVKGIDPPTESQLEGYRPLVDGDIGKVFGVDLDEKIYFEYDFVNNYYLINALTYGVYSSGIVFIDWVVPNAVYKLELRSGVFSVGSPHRYNSIYFQGGNETNEIDIYQAYNDDGDDWYSYFDTMFYIIPEQSTIDSIYYADIKDFIFVKDIEEVDEELIGYRPLVDSDIGKEFGIDLDCKIYFSPGLSVPIYESDTLLADWVFPDSLYMFELRTTPLTFDGNDLYERFNYFQGGNLVGEIDIMTTYSYIYDIEDETNDYYITDYTLPLKSYINDIYYDYIKGLILVKDLDLTDEEIGYINGYEDGKRDYGGFLDGQWFTAEDYGAWEYDRGLSESIDVVGVMVGGVFSSLTALGNVEILPGLKIFYIVGIFVVFGVVGFIIQKKFGGDD